MPTGVGAGTAKIFNYRVRGSPGLHLIFLKFGHRNEYGKVRYTKLKLTVGTVPKGVTAVYKVDCDQFQRV